MNVRKLLLAAVAAGPVLLAAACHDDEASAGPATVTALAASEIGARTDESAAPLPLNDLTIDEADTNETSSPLPVN